MVDPIEIWVAHNAVKLEADNEVFWAFPSALRRLKGGLPSQDRDFRLDGATKQAEYPTPVGK